MSCVLVCTTPSIQSIHRRRQFYLFCSTFLCVASLSVFFRSLLFNRSAGRKRNPQWWPNVRTKREAHVLDLPDAHFKSSIELFTSWMPSHTHTHTKQSLFIESTTTIFRAFHTFTFYITWQEVKVNMFLLLGHGGLVIRILMVIIRFVHGAYDTLLYLSWVSCNRILCMFNECEVDFSTVFFQMLWDFSVQ